MDGPLQDRPLFCSLGVELADFDAVRLGLLTKVYRNAIAAEDQGANRLGRNDRIVGFEWGGFAVALPVWPKEDLANPVVAGPCRRNAFHTLAMTFVAENHVGILGKCLVQNAVDFTAVLGLCIAGDGNLWPLDLVAIGLFAIVSVQKLFRFESRAGCLRVFCGAAAGDRRIGLPGLDFVALAAFSAMILSASAFSQGVSNRLDVFSSSNSATSDPS